MRQLIGHAQIAFPLIRIHATPCWPSSPLHMGLPAQGLSMQQLRANNSQRNTVCFISKRMLLTKTFYVRPGQMT